MTNVELSIVPAERRHVLENLFQLYVHDFSELWAGTPRGELGNDGRFEPYWPLASYWTQEDRVPLLIASGGQLAGFALVNAAGHTGKELDHNMAEFFVVRKYRRSGVGMAAAAAIFDRYAGAWEVGVMRANTNALAFWRRAIESHPKVRDVELVDLQTEAWDGPVFRFRVEG